MNARKLKDTSVKKQKTNKPKKGKVDEKIEEVTAAENSGTSTDNNGAASAEEDLLEKERIRAENMEERFLRVNASLKIIKSV